MKSIGERIKNLRMEMNLSPDSVSTYLKIPVEQFINIENGDEEITLSILDKLCALFGCSESYLLCKSDEFDPTPFALRSEKIETGDLEGIAKMNKLYMNLKYINKKMEADDK